MPKFKKDLLSKGSKTVKLIVGPLTGNCRFNKSMGNLALMENLCGDSVRRKRRSGSTGYANAKDQLD